MKKLATMFMILLLALGCVGCSNDLGAYEIWLKSGHTGTEEDFLLWLQGQGSTVTPPTKPTPEKPQPGLSAYEIFMKYNPDYEGDEETWIDDLANHRLARYTVTFKQAGEDGEDVVLKTPFYHNEIAEELIPAPPQKAGNVAVWDRKDFTEIEEDTVVYPVYTTAGLVYTLNEDGTAYSVSGSEDCIAEEIFIPSQREGLPVTEISEKAFSKNESVKFVTVDDGIVKIGNSAFAGCLKLEKITLPESVESLGHLAFSECACLGEFTFPEKVTSVGMYSFFGCGLKKIELPEGVISIAQGAFSDCEQLKEITLPEGLISIGEEAFRGCKSLESVVLPDGVISLGNMVFSDCISLKFAACSPDMTVIGSRAFCGCSALEAFVLPRALHTVGESAFSDCSNLKKVYFSGSEEEFDLLIVGVDNPDLKKGLVYYYSEKLPEKDAEQFWHYDKETSLPVIWQGTSGGVSSEPASGEGDSQDGEGGEA